MGSDGALLALPGQRIRIAPHRVEAVDATGAGDTFDGAFLARLLEGDDPETAAPLRQCRGGPLDLGLWRGDPIPRREAPSVTALARA